MKPDTKNTWIDTELGSFDAPSSAEMERGTPSKSTRHDLVFFFTRFVFALSIACHGSQKLFGIFGGQQNLHDPWMLGAGILEFGGGLALALGLFTRPIALLLCGEMAAAYFVVRFPGGIWPILNHGELEVLYCFFFLYLSMHGAGAISIDGLRGKA